MLKALKAEWGKVTIDPKIDIFLEKWLTLPILCMSLVAFQGAS
jgi:hypothetical protein